MSHTTSPPSPPGPPVPGPGGAAAGRGRSAADVAAAAAGWGLRWAARTWLNAREIDLSVEDKMSASARQLQLLSPKFSHEFE